MAEQLVQLLPRDEHNLELERNVKPTDWLNPKPQGRYHLVVIGAGTAGLVTAAGAAGLGARVALVERELMGGDCLNVGCVPSKGLISAARVARNAKYAGDFGVDLPGGFEVNFAKVMERMRRLRAKISPADSVARFSELGIDVFLGEASFLDSNHVKVGDTTLEFKKAVIATGARASAPPIPGLDGVDHLTNESVFSLTELPKRLGVIGAGPIGCELAQSFAHFGSDVFLVEATHGIMPREDPEASAIVKQSMIRDGVNLLCCGRDTKVEKRDDGIHLTLDSHDKSYDERIDQLLVAVGRAPNVTGIGLETVGVDFDPRVGVTVDDKLRTTNPNIFAAGDVCSKYKFTHTADFMARIVIQNALFPFKAKASKLIVPWCTYTSPEIAHVGLYDEEAQEQGIEIDTYIQKLEHVDRAILEGDDEGFVKVHTQRGKDRILGATIVATNAGDLISEITLAMKSGTGLGTVGATIHPYPTQAEAIRKLGDQYGRTRLTPFKAKLLKLLMG
jgi:pyruvate/2-oxoglutarate dehydrogenase complex dihydrolipoamide dehydrogenase (E3) component